MAQGQRKSRAVIYMLSCPFHNNEVILVNKELVNSGMRLKYMVTWLLPIKIPSTPVSRDWFENGIFILLPRMNNDNDNNYYNDNNNNKDDNDNNDYDDNNDNSSDKDDVDDDDDDDYDDHGHDHDHDHEHDRDHDHDNDNDNNSNDNNNNIDNLWR